MLMITSRNAIILAAGKSTRFAPFTYERPKGLFRVKGEILIERQIKTASRSRCDRNLCSGRLHEGEVFLSGTKVSGN